MNTRFLFLTVFLLLVSGVITLTLEQAAAQSRRGLLAEATDDGDVHYKWMDGDNLLEVRLKGDVAFTTDDRAVESMSRDGLLKIEERKGGTKRTLEVRLASGVRFVPIRFTPRASKYKGQECGGVNLIVTDRREFHSLRTGIELARCLKLLYPKSWNTKSLDRLLSSPPIGFGRSRTTKDLFCSAAASMASAIV